MTPLIVENLCKSYPTRQEPLVVLDHVSIELEEGESLAILGPSGSGKSTLLHILGALDRPTAGKVRYGPTDPFELDELGLAQFRHHQIGFVFQEHFLLPQLNVLENVLLPFLATSRVTPEDQAWALQLIDRVGLADRLSHRPAELSGGERQRVAIARSMVMRPTILLADEPTGNLDHSTALGVMRLLVDSLQDPIGTPKMLVMVTHNAELALELSRQAAMHQRTLVESRRSD